MRICLLTILLGCILQTAGVAQDMLSFADSLAEAEDHYRAITEYQRFLHYHPDDPRRAYAQLAIAKSLLAGERWQQANAVLQQIWIESPDSPEAKQARRLYAEAAERRGDYVGAEQGWRNLLKEANADHPEIHERLGLNALQLQDPDLAHRYFSALNEPRRSQLLDELEEFQHLPQKDPLLAGSLSAILPGAGQLYTEQPRQAGLSFALNGAFIYAAIESWENENYALAGILSLFELGWYGGNIYNAMNNAHQFNRHQQQSFLEELQQRLDLTLGWRHDHPELSAQFRF